MSKLNILFILLIVLLVLIRFINLGNIPIFGDEALYLWLADLAQKNSGNFLKSVSYGVFPINIWLLAILEFITGHIFNPLLLGRAIETFFDLGTAGLVFLTGKRLFGKVTGAVALVIYLTLPLSFFHSRFTLLDPLTNFFATAAVFSSLRLTDLKKTNKILTAAVLLGLFLVLGFFTKPIAVVVYGAIITTPILVLFSSKKKFNIEAVYKPLLGLSLGFLLLFISLLIFYFPVSHQFTDRFVSSADKSFSAIFSQVKGNLWLIYWWGKVYLSLPIILVIIFSSLLIAINKQIKLLWLYLWLGSLIFLEALFSARLFPRHILMIGPPSALIVSYFFTRIFGKNLILMTFFLTLTLLLNFNLISKIIIDPKTAPIALEDKQQFFEDWTAGEGFKEISDKIKNVSANSDSYIVYTENDPSFVWTFSNLYELGENNVYGSTNLSKQKFLDKNELNLGAGKDKFIILNKNPDAPIDWPVQLISAFPKGQNRTVNLYKVIEN